MSPFLNVWVRLNGLFVIVDFPCHPQDDWDTSTAKKRRIITPMTGKRLFILNQIEGSSAEVAHICEASHLQANSTKAVFPNNHSRDRLTAWMKDEFNRQSKAVRQSGTKESEQIKNWIRLS